MNTRGRTRCCCQSQPIIKWNTFLTLPNSRAGRAMFWYSRLQSYWMEKTVAEQNQTKHEMLAIANTNLIYKKKGSCSIISSLHIFLEYTWDCSLSLNSVRLQNPRNTHWGSSEQLSLFFLAYRQEDCQTKANYSIIKDILWELLRRSCFKTLPSKQAI